MTCRCPVPREPADPRRKGICLKCALPIDPAALSSDDTLREFFGALSRCFPGAAAPSFAAFRRQCEARERAGRDDFGLSYLSRDNIAESLEEQADFAIYLYLDHLRQLRAAGEDEDIALALEGALLAYRAYDCARRLAAARRERS